MELFYYIQRYEVLEKYGKQLEDGNGNKSDLVLLQNDYVYRLGEHVFKTEEDAYVYLYNTCAERIVKLENEIKAEKAYLSLISMKLRRVRGGVY